MFKGTFHGCSNSLVRVTCHIRIVRFSPCNDIAHVVVRLSNQGSGLALVLREGLADGTFADFFLSTKSACMDRRQLGLMITSIQS